MWHELFTAYQRFADETIDRVCYDKILNFFLDLKAGLAALKPAPDYMILDFRPGATELSTTLINAWVDTLVYTFAFNEDNIDYLARTFDKLLLAGNSKNHHDAASIDNVAPFEIKVALSRIPTNAEYRGDRLLFSALHSMGLKWDALHVLHSDRDLEASERLRTGFQVRPQNRRLTHDYMKLFEELIEPSRLPAGWLAKEIGLAKNPDERDRLFNWELTTGALINPTDNSRNVAFKVETFQLLLKGLEDGLVQLLHEENVGRGAITIPSHHGSHGPESLVRPHLLDSVLRSAGQKCGQCFGRALAEGWSSKIELGIEAKIRQWCEFDSDVGFGKFDVDPTTIEVKGSRLVSCDIRLRESFLTPAEDTCFKKAGDHQFCSLMTGYIQGVLSEILKCQLDVTHEPMSLENSRDVVDATEMRSESCVFHAKG